MTASVSLVMGLMTPTCLLDGVLDFVSAESLPGSLLVKGTSSVVCFPTAWFGSFPLVQAGLVGLGWRLSVGSLATLLLEGDPSWPPGRWDFLAAEGKLKLSTWASFRIFSMEAKEIFLIPSSMSRGLEGVAGMEGVAPPLALVIG